MKTRMNSRSGTQLRIGKRFLQTLAVALAPFAAAPSAFAADAPATPAPAPTAKAPAPAAAAPSAKAPAPTPAPSTTESPKDDTVRLDAVSVEADTVSASALPIRPGISLYGFEELVQNTPRSVFQISKAQLDSDNIRNFTDFARYSPSIQRGTTTTYSVANLRGSSADTARNGTILFNPALRPFDNNAWESVDVVAGVPSVVQGNTARTSGYVNYITKRPYFDGEHATLSFQLGRVGLDAATSYGQYSVQLDYSRVLIKDELAVRVSVQRSEASQYWGGSAADFKDIYAATTWKPTKNVTIEANFSYLASEGAIPWGINRVDQALISDWTYPTGEYVPRITWSGTQYTYNPGRGGYTYGSGNFIALGSEPWSQSSPGVLNFVPPPDGLERVPIEGHQVVEGKNRPNNVASEYIAQVNTTLQANEHFKIVHRGTFQYINNRNNNYDFMYSEHPNRLFETRLEFQTDFEFKPFDIPIRHQSNNGFGYRYLLNGCDAAISSLHSGNVSTYADVFSPYGADLAPRVSSPIKTVRADELLNVRPIAGQKYGVIESGYGYIQWEPSWADGGTYRSLSIPGFANWQDRRWNYLQNFNFFSEHKFDIGKYFTWRIAGRLTYINDYVKGNDITRKLVKEGYNGYTINLNDSYHGWNSDINTSLSFHPVSWLNLYVTYDANESLQGCGCCESAGWSSINGQNRLDPTRFDVPSELFEIGAKFDILPNRLWGSAAWFHQTRSNPSFDISTGGTVSYDNLYQGAEFALTWRPSDRALIGANYAYIHTTNQRTGQRFTGSPLNSFNLWGSYQFDNGFGVKSSLWVTSSWNITGSGSVRVPAQYNVDLGVFYVWKNWRIDVDIMNVTDEKNWGPSGALAGNTYSYLLPLERFGFQFKITANF